MNELLEKYVQILIENIEKDQEFINNPWMIFTILPLCFYIIFALIKWYFLLAPITVPIGFFAWGMKIQSFLSKFKKSE